MCFDGVIVSQWIQMWGLEPMSEGSEPQVPVFGGQKIVPDI